MSFDKNLFTREELKTAIAEERVFTYAPELKHGDVYEGHSLNDYPYVVFADYVTPAKCLIADAWHINDRGEIYPGHVSPVPVVLSEVENIVFSPLGLRRKLFSFVQATRTLHAGFINEPTMRVAQVLVSHSDVWRHLRSHVTERHNWLELAGKVLRSYASMNRRLFSPGPIALSDVDWLEVAAQFDGIDEAGIAVQDAREPSVLVSDASPTHARVPSSPAEGSLPTKAIPEDVMQILKQCRADGNHIYLPRVTLDRTLYKRVDQVLIDLGGKWVGGSRRAHVFDEPALSVLEACLSTGRYMRPRDLGFFPTPAPLVTRLLAKSSPERGMSVLEPEAGEGDIAIPLSAAVGSLELVRVCELLERNARKLQEAGFTNVVQGDFLQLRPERLFAKACMNPPFAHNQDIDHVLHASRFVRPGGTVTSIMSRHWMHSQHKKAQDFKRFLDAVKADVEEIDAGAFRSSGTEVATMLVHFSL